MWRIHFGRFASWFRYANSMGWRQWAKSVEWLNDDRKQVLGITFGIILLWWVTTRP